MIVGCEGPTGPAGSDGENGQDGVSNISTEIIQMTNNNTYFVDGDDDGLGYIYHEYSSELITENVINNGTVMVEYSPGEPYDWTSLPFILHHGDFDGVDYVLNCFYHYSEESVTIQWHFSSGFPSGGWLDVIEIWGKHYKISIITPTP